MNNPETLRAQIFFSVLIFMILIEFIIPQRKLLKSRISRWSNNLLLTFVNTLMLKLLLPFSASAFALIIQDYNLGLLNNFNLPPPSVHIFIVILSIVILDMIIYWQHRLFHVVPILWKLHRVHHTDEDIDVTTALRFHPIEILLSMVIKFSAIALFGFSAESVILFEIILNGSAMFNHGNIALPKLLDKLLRKIIVTPDMHRIHHSIMIQETNSNYGFFLSIWDKLFRSYTNHPIAGQKKMIIGIREFIGGATVGIHNLLIQPFIKK